MITVERSEGYPCFFLTRRGDSCILPSVAACLRALPIKGYRGPIEPRNGRSEIGRPLATNSDPANLLVSPAPTRLFPAQRLSWGDSGRLACGKITCQKCRADQCGGCSGKCDRIGGFTSNSSDLRYREDVGARRITP